MLCVNKIVIIIMWKLLNHSLLKLIFFAAEKLTGMHYRVRGFDFFFFREFGINLI